MARRGLRLPATTGGDKTPPFERWLPLVTPSWQWHWPHLRYIRDQLDRITSGEINRLMLFVPPRHGKSEMGTVRYPVWRLERDPTLRVIVGAYNQTLANKFSRKARRIARGRLTLSSDRAAVEEWETASGGGMRVVGVGGGIAGQGADLILIDDPVKNREEAESPAYRERVWDWYTDDLYTRLEPGGAIVLTMTRWHMDDLAGRILDSEDGPNWTVVKLPALAEDGDPMGRTKGEALCPERYDEEALAGIATVLGNAFTALFQQRPVPEEGEFFKREWFAEKVDAVPAGATTVRYWDKAGTQGGGKFSAGVRMSEYRGTYYVEDVERGQWGAVARESVIRDTAEEDGRRVTVWAEQEPGSGGKESAESTVKNLAGYAIFTERVTGEKETRARPFASQARAGNVKLVRGRWNAAYVEELTSFPQGKYSDQVDASSGAFNKLALRKNPGRGAVDDGPGYGSLQGGR